MNPIHIGFLIYPDVVALDAIGAYQVLAFSPDTQVRLIGKTRSPITSNEGLILTPDLTIEDCPALDVICVPGGGMGQIAAMQDPEILAFLQHQAVTARYVTSVCTGSLILAAAGLLQGYKSACHWAFREQLASLGVEVSSQRVTIDRDRVTAAGVTSSIDFGLTLLALLCGETTAKTAQLMMEYVPEPPFNAGSPATAGTEIVSSLIRVGKPLLDAFDRQTQATAARLQAAADLS